MRKLILIKHAAPQIDPAVETSKWKLSEKGRSQCAALAERLRGRGIDRIITSDEDKAVETGKIVAGSLGIPCEIAHGLHEHDRSNVPVMPSSQFISYVALFFQKPTELVLGRETADQALASFSRSIDEVLAKYPERTLAVVTHGTVLSLFAASHESLKPFELWRELQLPSFIVLDAESMRMIEKVSTV